MAKIARPALTLLDNQARSENRAFWVTCSRGVGGALIFSVPLLMTMEMWHLGFYIDNKKLLLFIVLLLPTLFGLSRYSGFEQTSGWKDDVVDGLVAFAIGASVSALSLTIIAVLTIAMSVDELVGKIALMTIPGAIGAILASKQLGEQGEQNSRAIRSAGYPGLLFIMGAGALFLCFSVAPTEEIMLLAYMMTPWHALALASVSLIVMHAIVFNLGFRGQAEQPEGMSSLQTFLHFTVVGYSLALLISAYVLWTFGRFDGLSLLPMVMSTVVLGFPAALGAAISRLII